jgi:hypothetical protein
MWKVPEFRGGNPKISMLSMVEIACLAETERAREILNN